MPWTTLRCGQLVYACPAQPDAPVCPDTGGGCAALAPLSFEPEARAQLQEAGALGAVLEICLTCQSNLTSVLETVTTRRCATTLCNISSDNNDLRRVQLVEQGIVNALSRLSES